MINARRAAEAPKSLATRTKYNARDVVDTLLRDFLGKCYLCEIRISVREHSVDHRWPKAQFPDLTYAWTNLFPSCRDCNERRPAFPLEGLLDPTCDDVETRLDQTTRTDARHSAEAPYFAAIDPGDARAVATARELNYLHNGKSVKAAELRAAINQRIDEILERVLEFHKHGSATRGPVRAA